MSTNKYKYLPYVMWLFPLAFFAYQFILRLWPGLMMQQIMAQLQIDASQFGVVAAFYYYGYAGMQIPVALLLERFGVRIVVCSFALICGLATIVFTYSTHATVACLSRLLIGAGSAVGFLGISKVVSEWFPAAQYTRMIGLSFSVGLMGAIYGGKPVSLLIQAYPWQQVALTLAGVSFLIACGAYAVLRSPVRQEPHQTAPKKSFGVSDLKAILSLPHLWLLALANLFMVGALEGFSDVWGVPYLMTAYALNQSDAAQLVSFIFVGMLFGGPFLAWCSKKIGDYPVMMLCGVGMASAFVILLFMQSYHGVFLACLFFSIGMLCCYQVIVFAAGAHLVKASQLGVTIAFLNCMNMLGGSFFHTTIGRLMDAFWVGEGSHLGVKDYTVNAYQYALLLIPVSACVGVAILVVLSRQRKSKTA